MNKRQAQRLLRVGKALRQSPNPQTFSMHLYLHTDESAIDQLNLEFDDNDNVVDENGAKVELNFCGTPACALGHYGARRDLQKLIRVGMTETFGFGSHPALLYGNNKMTDYSDPTIIKHFGITEDQAFDLFDSNGCDDAQTAVEAAEYIEAFVRQEYGPVTL